MKNNRTIHLFRLSPTCIKLMNETTELPVHHEFIVVECPNNRKDGFAIVAEKRTVEKRIEKYKVEGADERLTNENRLNVIVLGLDSTSRLNFLR
jgi:hypothetical protein